MTPVRILSGLLRRALLGRVPRLFDEAYYRARNPGVARSGLDPFLHYALVGARRGLDPNADFDTAFYRGQSGPTRLDPVRHYLRVGAERGLDPSPAFSTSLYRARYPDVVRAGINPLQHWRSDGRAEGREAAPSPLAAHRLRALDGVAPEHDRLLPDRPEAAFDLELLRALPAADLDAFAPRLCLRLCLDGPAFDALLDALRVFETGPQDAIRLHVGPGPTRPPVPTLLLAFERCFHAVSGDGRTLRLRYAEVRAWDLRGAAPGVAAVFSGGCLAAGAWLE